MSATLRIDVPSPGIRLATIDRPERRNALDVATYDGLTAAVTAAEQEAGVRVLVLTGAEGCFTSGNDLADFQKDPGSGPSAAMRFLKTLTAARKPVLAAIEGFAVGIGTTMLLHCDLAYAGRGARFRLPFVALGLCPEGASSYLLPRAAGSKRAAELLMLGEAFTAEEAAAAGIVNAVTEDGGALAAALERARALVQLPAESVTVTKMLLRRGAEHAIVETLDEEARHFAARRRSPEAQAAFAAFFAKRPPGFGRG